MKAVSALSPQWELPSFRQAYHGHAREELYCLRRSMQGDGGREEEEEGGRRKIEKEGMGSRLETRIRADLPTELSPFNALVHLCAVATLLMQ